MLIILSKSPSDNDYGSVLKIAEKATENGEKMEILHIQDACIATTMGEYCEKLSENKIGIYALKADCEARGLMEKVSREIRIIDYEQWVKLVMSEHERIVSWTT